MFGIKDWREKRKFKHKGWVRFYGRHGKFWIFPEGTSTYCATFWENGYGKRKVTGDELIKEMPEIVAWLAGFDLPEKWTASAGKGVVPTEDYEY